MDGITVCLTHNTEEGTSCITYNKQASVSKPKYISRILVCTNPPQWSTYNFQTAYFYDKIYIQTYSAECFPRTNLMHCLFLVYWSKIPLHVSSINSPSSGGVFMWWMVLLRWLSTSLGGAQADSHCHINTPYLLMMDCWCPKHAEVS
jgi:hypothetical protein